VGPYLLDTSTLLWLMGSSERLSARARKAIIEGPLLLSVVNYWEIVIKSRKGALEIPDPVSWWARANTEIGGEVLSIRTTHVSALASLPMLHRDPFDRMLVAQAVAEGFALVTGDASIERYGVKVVW
jgi:PIN domain nuclease of toxin-antitoxin system